MPQFHSLPRILALTTNRLAVALMAATPAHAQSLDDNLKAAFEAGELRGLHAVIIDLQGERLAESYFRGRDRRRGQPLGMVDHGPRTLHDLRSVTKSIVGLLYGIALEEGKVPAPDAKLLDQFPEYSDLKDGSAREAIRVGHALSMMMGIEWDESLPYSDPRNSEIAMDRAADPIRYVLDRPMVDTPGEKRVYNGGATAVLARLIADGTGMPIDVYARIKLFDPLKIETFEWVRAPDGAPSAASGLRLTARDLARIGAMVAKSGFANGRQIVPRDWLDESFKVRSVIEPGLGYGYQWYIAGRKGDQIAMALGNGGQRLTVQAKIGLVVVSFAGNYNLPYAWQTPWKVVDDFAVPEVHRRLDR